MRDSLYATECGRNQRGPYDRRGESFSRGLRAAFYSTAVFSFRAGLAWLFGSKCKT